MSSVYLWVLPMFHAAGWTYPWAATFAASAQITVRNVSYPLIWNHLSNSFVTHYCGAPTVQVLIPVPEPRALSLPFDAHHFQQTGLVNCRQVKKLPRPVTAIIAGSAPTAHLIASLEKLGIIPVHVYGLTSVLPFLSFNLPRRLSSSQRGKLRPYTPNV